jgi:hypothetical protein
VKFHAVERCSRRHFPDLREKHFLAPLTAVATIKRHDSIRTIDPGVDPLEQGHGQRQGCENRQGG